MHCWHLCSTWLLFWIFFYQPSKISLWLMTYHQMCQICQFFLNFILAIRALFIRSISCITPINQTNGVNKINQWGIIHIYKDQWIFLVMNQLVCLSKWPVSLFNLTSGSGLRSTHQSFQSSVFATGVFFTRSYPIIGSIFMVFFIRLFNEFNNYISHRIIVLDVLSKDIIHIICSKKILASTRLFLKLKESLWKFFECDVKVFWMWWCALVDIFVCDCDRVF